MSERGSLLLLNEQNVKIVEQAVQAINNGDADGLLALFADDIHGGFYFTAVDHEKLIQRPKSWQDEAMPSGNAVAALALHRLGILIGQHSYTQSAEKALQSVADNLHQTPFHAAGFIALLEAINRPPQQIIVRAEQQHLAQWREQILPRLKPDQSAFFIANDIEGLPQEIAQKTSAGGSSAWICEGFSCRAPIDNIEDLLAELETVIA